MPPPSGQEIRPPFGFTRWDFDNGLLMSVTRDVETGEVLYIEVWPSDVQAQPAPIDGMTYGVTTLGGLRQRFGSEGVVFESRGRMDATPHTAIHFTSYEVADSSTVISFVTIQPLEEASAETAENSTLDSVIVADSTFLDQSWGLNRGRLPGYQQIESPFSDE